MSVVDIGLIDHNSALLNVKAINGTIRSGRAWLEAGTFAAHCARRAVAHIVGIMNLIACGNDFVIHCFRAFAGKSFSVPGGKIYPENFIPRARCLLRALVPPRAPMSLLSSYGSACSFK